MEAIMSESIPVFTSSTDEGSIEHKPVIQPVVSTVIRVNDPRYGISTGARRVHDQVSRQEFARQRDEAIAKQRARENEKRAARLREIDGEILRLQAAWESGNFSDEDKIKARLKVLLDKHDALVAKMAG
jgi:hypothetical protein